MRQVVFQSMAAACALPGRDDWAVISITEPGTPQALLQPGWRAVLRLQFHDADTSTRAEYKLFSTEDAQTVLAFVGEVAPHITGLLVHCHAGVSRSAAVAKAIAERHALPYPESYSLYNKWVYRQFNRLDWAGAVGSDEL